MSGRPGCRANVVVFQFPVGRFCFARSLCYFSALARLMANVTVDIGGCVKPTALSLGGVYGMASHSSLVTSSSLSVLFQYEKSLHQSCVSRAFV